MLYADTYTFMLLIGSRMLIHTIGMGTTKNRKKNFRHYLWFRTNQYINWSIHINRVDRLGFSITYRRMWFTEKGKIDGNKNMTENGWIFGRLMIAVIFRCVQEYDSIYRLNWMNKKIDWFYVYKLKENIKNKISTKCARQKDAKSSVRVLYFAIGVYNSDGLYG